MAVAVAGLLTLGAPATAARATTPTLAQLVGQRLIVAFAGTHADANLLARIRAGHVGGVILFGANVKSPAQLTALDASLQAAAHAGGQPRLIIATDQEGGEVKRIPWAPPGRSAKQLGALPASAVDPGRVAHAATLHADGVNVDLAPVADVPHGPADFIEQQQRAFSTNRFTVAMDAPAFAGGLESRGVWPTLKHFPGLGLATVSTDVALVRITRSGAHLDEGPPALQRRVSPQPRSAGDALDGRLPGARLARRRLVAADHPRAPARQPRLLRGHHHRLARQRRGGRHRPLPAWPCGVPRPAPTCS